MDLSLKMMLYQMVNFLILITIIGYIFNKFLRPFMKKRAEDIKTAFQEIDRKMLSVEE